jgi:hypothetical protein
MAPDGAAVREFQPLRVSRGRIETETPRGDFVRPDQWELARQRMTEERERRLKAEAEVLLRALMLSREPRLELVTPEKKAAN